MTIYDFLGMGGIVLTAIAFIVFMYFDTKFEHKGQK